MARISATNNVMGAHSFQMGEVIQSCPRTRARAWPAPHPCVRWVTPLCLWQSTHTLAVPTPSTLTHLTGLSLDKHTTIASVYWLSIQRIASSTDRRWFVATLFWQAQTVPASASVITAIRILDYKLCCVEWFLLRTSQYSLDFKITTYDVYVTHTIGSDWCNGCVRNW